MFWGLIMEPQRRYTQRVKKAFHISMAALDISTAADEPAQVMCGFEGRNYLLCTLRKGEVNQCPLDLNFEVGNEVSFAANGKCHVHLTGFLNEEFPVEDEDDSSDAEEEEVVTKESKKRQKKALENGLPKKKAKQELVSSSANKEDDSSDDDSSDDSDVDMGKLLNSTVEEDSDDDSFAVEEAEDSDANDGEEEEDENAEEEEEDNDDDDEEEDKDSDEEEEVEAPKGKQPKMNGIAKKPENEKLSKKQRKLEEQNKKEQKSPKSEKKEQSKKRTLQGGVIVEDLLEGQGQPAKNGRFVSVYYEGRLKSNNKMFDSSKKGAGFSFKLGNGDVIKAWDVGIAGMKQGGKRRITCPPNMAYGQRGSPPAIPANSTLVFEVDLRKVN